MQVGEQTILIFRKHWFILFLRVAAVLVLAALPFTGYAYFLYIGAVPRGLNAAHFFDFLGAFWLVVIFWSIAGIWTKYYLDMWIITTRRVISVEQNGLFDREVTAWSIERILQVSIRVGNFLETFLNYGSLEISTAGDGNAHETVHGIPNPELIREVIMREASRVSTLEEANRNQEQLLHTISHEVKSYLTKDAASLAYIAEGGAGDPAQMRTFAQSALSETRKGVSAVMSLLSGSNAKSGTIQISTSSFDARSMIEELFNEFKSIAQRKQIAYTFKASNDHYMVTGDMLKLRDLVFRNLIDNALRYTTQGSVQIELTKTSTAMFFSITDTGVGISSEDMQKLFTAGGKGEHSSDVNPDSTGFGLFSAKQLVLAHGGDINAHSDGVGRGSTFTVRLPLSN